MDILESALGMLDPIFHFLVYEMGSWGGVWEVFALLLAIILFIIVPLLIVATVTSVIFNIVLGTPRVLGTVAWHGAQRFANQPAKWIQVVYYLILLGSAILIISIVGIPFNILSADQAQRYANEVTEFTEGIEINLDQIKIPAIVFGDSSSLPHIPMKVREEQLDGITTTYALVWTTTPTETKTVEKEYPNKRASDLMSELGWPIERELAVINDGARRYNEDAINVATQWKTLCLRAAESQTLCDANLFGQINEHLIVHLSQLDYSSTIEQSLPLPHQMREQGEYDRFLDAYWHSWYTLDGLEQGVLNADLREAERKRQLNDIAVEKGRLHGQVKQLERNGVKNKLNIGDINTLLLEIKPRTSEANLVPIVSESTEERRETTSAEETSNSSMLIPALILIGLVVLLLVLFVIYMAIRSNNVRKQRRARRRQTLTGGTS